jgi:hypothetical protein
VNEIAGPPGTSISTKQRPRSMKLVLLDFHPRHVSPVSARGISLSSSTSTIVNPQQDVPAPVDGSSLLSVTDNKTANKGDQWETISTISPLLRETLGVELGIYNEIYACN